MTQMQQSGGLLLTPVQTLVSTIIFARGKSAMNLRRGAMRPLPVAGKGAERAAMTIGVFSIICN